MSFGFSVSDFITVGALANQLRNSYRSAPTEYVSLSTNLEVLVGVFDRIRRDSLDDTAALGRCTAQQHEQLGGILGQIRLVLDALERIRSQYQNLEGRMRVWNRVTFPQDDIRHLQARLHLNLSGLKLFLEMLNGETSDRILQVLERLANEQMLTRTSMEALARRMGEQGVTEEEIAEHRQDLEELLEAANDVQETASNLGPQSVLRSGMGTSTGSWSEFDTSTVFGGPVETADIDDRENFQVGAPEKERLRPRTCAGTQRLIQGEVGGFRRKALTSLTFPYRYIYQCQKCRYICSRPTKPKNTLDFDPYFFERQTLFTPSDIEFHLETRIRVGVTDGAFFREIFLWKCHASTDKQYIRDEYDYECPFCPIEISAGRFYKKDELLDHILSKHVQDQISLELRKKYNVWIEDSPAIFQHLDRTRGQQYDLLLPRPYTRREGTIARIARDSHKMALQQEQSSRANSYSRPPTYYQPPPLSPLPYGHSQQQGQGSPTNSYSSSPPNNQPIIYPSSPNEPPQEDGQVQPSQCAQQ